MSTVAMHEIHIWACQLSKCTECLMISMKCNLWFVERSSHLIDVIQLRLFQESNLKENTAGSVLHKWHLNKCFCPGGHDSRLPFPMLALLDEPMPHAYCLSPQSRADPVTLLSQQLCQDLAAFKPMQLVVPFMMYFTKFAGGHGQLCRTCSVAHSP